MFSYWQYQVFSVTNNKRFPQRSIINNFQTIKSNKTIQTYGDNL